MRDAELLVDISQSCGTKPGFPLSHSRSCRRLDGGPDSWPPQRPLGNRQAADGGQQATTHSAFKRKIPSDHHFVYSFYLFSLLRTSTAHLSESQTNADKKPEPSQVAELTGATWVVFFLPVGVRCCSRPAGGLVPGSSAQKQQLLVNSNLLNYNYGFKQI